MSDKADSQSRFVATSKTKQDSLKTEPVVITESEYQEHASTNRNGDFAAMLSKLASVNKKRVLSSASNSQHLMRRRRYSTHLAGSITDAYRGKEDRYQVDRY
jgi:hypothetical protein